MDLNDSADVRNAVRIRSILVAGGIYFFLAISTFGLILIVLLVFGLMAHLICTREMEALRYGSNKFRKTFPFRFFGESFGDFQHVFYHDANLEGEIVATVERELKTRTPVGALAPITVTDVDPCLGSPEDRSFLMADSGRTRRGTTVTLILKLSRFGQMQSIRWWVLAGGYVDKDKHFNFVAYAPFTLLFWIIPYLRREYDVLSRIRTIYAAAYNDMDVVTQIRCLHEAVFGTMVEVLDKNGIDTSDIKAQRMQVMNISISGGRVNMGNVVQGAMNKVAATVRGAK